MLVRVELRKGLSLVRSLHEVAHLEPAALGMRREDAGADGVRRRRH